MADTTPRLTHADVERIIQIAGDAELGYVHFESDGLAFTLVKEGYEETSAVQAGPVDPAVPAAAGTMEEGPRSPVPSVDSAESAGVAAVPAAPEPPAVEDPGSDLAADAAGHIHAPLEGIFYRTPDPESPPYIEVGQHVDEGDAIGLLEVMKMYTAVQAVVAGRVAEILVEHGAQVERGQPLVRIEKD